MMYSLKQSDLICGIGAARGQLHLDGVVLAVQQAVLQPDLLAFVYIWSSPLQALSSQQELFDCRLLTVLSAQIVSSDAR